MVEAKTSLTYQDYLNTPDDERYELLNGELIVIAAPNTAHQRTTFNLAFLLRIFVEEHSLGEVFVSPYDVVLSETNVLQPDVTFVSNARRSIVTDKNIEGVPDLVVEVMSPSTDARDRETKRRIYARHGVPEYWLADPEERTVSVMTLVGKEFRESGVYAGGDALSSPTLPGLSLTLADVFPST